MVVSGHYQHKHTHIKAPLQNFTVLEKRFSQIHVDLVGPLKPSAGYTHLLTIVDRTTRWPEVIPLRETTSVECARALIGAWISRFGIPIDITSDRGPQFISALWSTISQQRGSRSIAQRLITHKPTVWWSVSIGH